MYYLTLTKEERKAIDWIGDRYAHGNDLFDVLNKCEHKHIDHEWDDDVDLVFEIPENIAWEISEIIDSEDHLTCFSMSLKEKLWDFRDGVV